MSIKYYQSDIEVKEGDEITYKAWFFWSKPKKGRISYVPGISKPHSEMEHDGCMWVGVSGEDGTFRGVWVEPEVCEVKKTVSYVSRSDNNNYIGPHDLKDGEW